MMIQFIDRSINQTINQSIIIIRYVTVEGRYRLSGGLRTPRGGSEGLLGGSEGPRGGSRAFWGGPRDPEGSRDFGGSEGPRGGSEGH